MKKVKKTNNAVFAGSFDPLTRGHLWIMDKSSKMFDHLTVIVRNKFNYKDFLSLEERVQNVKDSVKHLKNVSVISIENEFTVKVASRLNAATIIRGIRNTSDYVTEQNNSHLNQDIDSQIITIFLMPPKTLMDVNSDFVKGLIGKEGWRPIIQKYIDAPTYQFLSLRNLKSRIEKDFKEFYNLLQIAEDKKMHDKIERIVNFYSSKDRFYHNFIHIDEMLDLLNSLSLNHLEKFILKMAIYYHDIIYDSSSNENEENSVKLMMKEWNSDLNIKFHYGKKQYNLSTILKEISKFIINSKDHRKLQDVKYKKLLKLFLDFDMAILGQEAERVWEYDEQIKKEFAGSPDKQEEYSLSRLAFFDKMLNSKIIFHSKEFSGYENKAANNLKLLKQKYLSKQNRKNTK